MFYREALLNNGESTSENVTRKNPFQFHDLIQTYRRRTAPCVPAPASVPSLAYESSEIITTQLPSTSTSDDLPIALQIG